MDFGNSLDAPVLAIYRFTGAELSAARLVVSLFYVYPIVIFQRYFLLGRPSFVQHIFYTVASIALLYFNFGFLFLHFIANIVLSYLILVVSGQTRAGVALSWLLNMGYLIGGYWSESNGLYVVTWTTPQCVLTLKLIGLAWDVYDGAQKDVKGKEDTALYGVPSFLEVLGFATFTPTLLTGPQISFRRYSDFSSGKFNSQLALSWSYATIRTRTGLMYTVFYSIISIYINKSFYFSTQYKELWLPSQLLFIGIWGQVLLMRYIGVWLIAEGSCIVSGVAYNGLDSNKEAKWDGCANIVLRRWLFGYTSQHLVESFNINTNKWVLLYVYKRLRFLNNRYISQAASLTFLASWHGISSGYYMNFFVEFLVMNAEKEVASLVASRGILRYIVEKSALRLPLLLFSKYIVCATLGYALISFELFFFDTYIEVYRSTGYAVHIAYILLPILTTLARIALPGKREDKKLTE